MIVKDATNKIVKIDNLIFIFLSLLMKSKIFFIQIIIGIPNIINK